MDFYPEQIKALKSAMEGNSPRLVEIPYETPSEPIWYKTSTKVCARRGIWKFFRVR